MKISISLAGQQYSIDTQSGWSLAIPLGFNQPQPNHFSASPATAQAMRGGSFVGDTELGGSCNVNEITINPHCNGTHTETLAHICHRSHPLSVTTSDVLPPPFIPCTLVSLTPALGQDTRELYLPPLNAADQVMTRKALERELDGIDSDWLEGLVIRTLPNKPDKQTRRYEENSQPAFLTTDAIMYLRERGVQHLVLDVPSLDRMHDDGLLTNHHRFWQVPDGSHEANQYSLLNHTITEMAFITDDLPDGQYFLSLNFPAWITDAAPCNPILYSASTRNESE
ncbi:cyclase family protein [Endozoicomonas sp.]|uniref:cyclase family protein n=1 Tax=Endozoicomonas sp. TaxID=1892382 RepID=UPI00383B2B00